MTWAYPLFAFALDLAIGDPRWIPHPVVIVGKGITWAESALRRCLAGAAEKAAGIILVVVIVIPTAGIMFLIDRFLFSLSGSITMVAAMLLFIYLASTTLALRGLITSARRVMKAVDDNDMATARQRLAMIVGRDTEDLGEEAILRATIETVAENLSDGVIAPLFYLIIGGLPLAFAYKAINTLDSMVGYKNERYLRFGWASARLDDLANYIPARLAGLAIVGAAFLYRLAIPRFREEASVDLGPYQSRVRSALRTAANSFRIMRRDGRNHTSPNSGVPEAAMAGAIGVRLGGPSTYGHIPVKKPYIGDQQETSYRLAAKETLIIATAASTVSVILSVALLFFIRNVR